MTLNITLLAEEMIYQSADFRLTDANTGGLITDSSSKLVVVGGFNLQGFVTYTGVGQWKAKSTADWITEWLTGHDVAPDEVAERIRQKGTSWLKRIERATKSRQRHSFVIAAFPNGRPTAWVISNFESVAGIEAAFPEPALRVSRLSFRGKPRVLITGQKPSVDRNARRRLEHLSAGPSDPPRIRRVLTEMNEAAAIHPRSRGTISAACLVVSFLSDGSGFAQVSPEATVDIRNMRGGMPMPSRKELEKLLGTELGGVSQAVFATSTSKELSLQCRPIRGGEQSEDYELLEIEHPDLESCSVLDISDSGLILGTGIFRGERGRFSTPWLSTPSGEPEYCGFVGHARAVNDEGVIAATVEPVNGEGRAHRWYGEEGEALDLHLGDTSWAADISEDGTVVGYVDIDAEERAQANIRPAAWLPDGELRVLENFGGDWGEAVAIVGPKVLVRAHLGSEFHALLWSLDDGSIRGIGDLGINPIDMTSTGIVLGTGRNAVGREASYLGRVEEPWRPLGIAPEASGSAITETGDVVGTTEIEGFGHPWLRRFSGEVLSLPYFKYHRCQPVAINSSGLIGGSASSDHGHHALLWKPT